MKPLLENYQKELESALQDILAYWQKYAMDETNGGFYGRIDNNNVVDPEAPKGAVLNSRILWSFSAGYNCTREPAYLQSAERAFVYLREHFVDKEFGGLYWSVDFRGNPLGTKKQMYALAFAVYGLSEFYVSSKNEEAKGLAVDLYDKLITYSYDRQHGGYLEALSRDWKETDDWRLSKKDANEKKSMNTHLHILEAFCGLYRIWKNEKLLERIIELVFLFLHHIIDKETGHLLLFFDEKWYKKSTIISYGHDIEAAWLIEEAALLTGNSSLIKQVKRQSVALATVSMEGLDTDGGLWYEYNMDTGELKKEKHSWPQAEAMVGFFNAWQISGDEAFLEQSVKSWQFIQKFILDKKNGEWFWGITEDNRVMDEDKAGIWKCPYHNSRSCIELLRRIKNIPAD